MQKLDSQRGLFSKVAYFREDMVYLIITMHDSGA